MSGGGGGEEGPDLPFTPTWVVALVCTIIVAVSFAVERSLHYLGKFLKKKNQKPLFQALQKIKEELMLVGFISLLLAVTQNTITKICVPQSWTLHMLPCSLEEKEHVESKLSSTKHFQTFFSSDDVFGTARRLLGDDNDQPSTEESRGYCASKGKVPLLSKEALHHLHIFIFVLAIVHVSSCVLTIIFGGLNIRRWKHWEESIVADENHQSQHAPGRIEMVTPVHQHAFIRDHFTGIGKDSSLMGWLKSFFKQFYGSVTKSDYETLRLGFIKTHCRGNPKFNFHKYMNRALEDDFKKVVGISWYLWIFVVIFWLLNIHGWHTYFWVAFIPVLLLLAVGTKLEHVKIQLAHEVAEKHTAIQGELVVKPSDDHFWFRRPRIVLFLIHLILFQNSFEIAFFFWILITYGFDSCIMGKIKYIIPRLVIGVFIQVLCSYSTLPLYAIVTQMGTHFKKAIFDDQVQARLVGWAQKAKKKGLRGDNNNQSAQGSSHNGANIQLGSVFRRGPAQEENTIVPINEESIRTCSN
ncbi:unnamed protein product [Trifolium pratense]|uniref:Uncharacterized protein n=1 Tax=Trifolium pratense TaxID=57577 RepID=A0ACB0L5V9_TRIPR|nr:unnamed protein product [Trifolium pratense]